MTGSFCLCKQQTRLKICTSEKFFKTINAVNRRALNLYAF